MSPILFPFIFWSALFRAASSGEGISPTKLGLVRNKKQEQMRRYPDWFDADGNFIPDPKDR